MDSEKDRQLDCRGLVGRHPWLPYVAPFAVFVVFLAAEWAFPEAKLWLYALKIVAVAIALWIFRSHFAELRWNFSLEAIAVGLLAFVIWVGLDPFYPMLGKRTSFDPTTIENFGARLAVISFRVAGAVLVVPLMEELFWRSFVIRYFVDADFKKVPIGKFTWPSFLIVAVLFGLEHHEWLAGLIVGVLYNLLLYRRKDVFSVVLAHAVTNAALSAYVLARGEWKFW
jgi:CAAX prenyl protease-like protein